MAIVRSAHVDGTEVLTDAAPVARMGSRRAQVLACLEEAAAGGASVSVSAVAERTGLHVNTARFHLDGLVEQGSAERSVEESGSPGRPRILYRPRVQPSGPRSYRLLGRMLGGLVAELDQDGSAALRAGRVWGRELVGRIPSDAAPGSPGGAAPVGAADGGRGDAAEQIDRAEALQRLDTLLDEVGFEPSDPAEIDGGEVEVQLHHCPFLEVATEWSEVVCAVHRGLMEGALEEVGAPVEVSELRPFVRPDLCVARLRNR